MSTAATTYRVYGLPLNAKSYDSNDDGTLTIIGVASTTNKDFANEIVSPEVLQSLAKQAPGLNLYRDHNRHYDGGIGAIVDAWVQDNELWIKATILPEYASGIKERLDIGMNFGFSISGFPRKQRTPEGILITDYKLIEITLTYIPMNWDTYGTVEYKDQNLITSNCLTGACYHAIQNDGEIMEDEKKNTNLEEEVPEEPVIDKKDNAGFSEEELSQIKNMMNEFGVELESRILESVEAKNSQIAEDAANKAAEATANKILAEIKATKEVQDNTDSVESKEIPEEDNVDDGEDEEHVPADEPEDKSDAGISEPTNGSFEDEEEDKNSQEDDEELDEKSLDQKIHDEIVKQMNEKSISSKFNKFKNSPAPSPKIEEKSVKRDMYGRNLKYV